LLPAYIRRQRLWLLSHRISNRRKYRLRQCFEVLKKLTRSCVIFLILQKSHLSNLPEYERTQNSFSLCESHKKTFCQHSRHSVTFRLVFLYLSNVLRLHTVRCLQKVVLQAENLNNLQKPACLFSMSFQKLPENRRQNLQNSLSKERLQRQTLQKHLRK